MSRSKLNDKSLWFWLPVAALVMLIGTAFSWHADEEDDSDKDRKQLWTEVQKAQNEGLPRTASSKLKLIYEKSLQEKDLPEAIKALGMHLMAEGSVEDPASAHMIRKMEAFVPESPEEIRPILKLLLADWYFGFYQENRWQFAQRDQTTVVPSDDFETWDLPRLLSHIDKLYRDALESAEPLKKIRVASYAVILTDAPIDDLHRPTLYDFVAFQALQFYQLDEQIVRQQGAFDVSAEGPVFGSQEEFLAWTPETQADESYLLQAVKILQGLIQFHQNDEDPTALLDAELQRFEFGNLVAVGSDKTDRYEFALQRFADQHQAHPLSSLALARLASSQYSRGDYLLARKTALIAQNRFEKSMGANMAYNLVQQIEQEELSIQTERVWNSASAQIEISYRNIEQVHFRLLPFDYAGWKKWGDYREPQNMDHEQRLALFRRPAVKEWKVNLKKTEDFQPAYHSAQGEIQGLKPGCYLLLSSKNANFQTPDNQLSITEVWISDLSLVLQVNYSEEELQGQVLNAITGAPIGEATIDVEAWVYDGRNSRSEKLTTVRTNAEGEFRFKRKKQSIHRLLISSGDQSIGVILYQNYYGGEQNPISYRTVFFTDRSIYRPGQTVQFKGVLLRSAQGTAKYETVANEKVTVKFWDVNHQSIEELQLTSNEYGSVSGSFTAPVDRATGSMQISAEGSEYQGATSISVEEYKRPKFYTELVKPETQFQLEQPVEISGKATAYTGANIDGAKVSWRVVREVRYPDWYYWRCWYCPPMGQAQEIANGETTTDVDGKFKVNFVAEPDRSVDRSSQPVFTYTVYADVTDTTGETRSANSGVRLGYTSLRAKLAIDQETWLTPATEIKFHSTISTLDGTGQAADGKLTIYKLQQPEKVAQGLLPGITGLRDQVLARLSQNNVKIDPVDLTPDMSNFERWSTGEEVRSDELKTEADGQGTNQVQLPAGAYRAKLVTTDAAGNEIVDEKTFLVIDPQAKKLDLKIPNLVRVEKASVQPGETFRVIWGTGYESGRAYVQWLHRGKVLKSFWTAAGQTQADLTFVPTEEHRGGLNLAITYVKENRAYTTIQRVDVPWKNKELTVKWEHFVSKLTPGGKETWTAIVTGPDGQRAVSEMVATLYDASLDAFSPHYWAQQLGNFYQDYLRSNFQYSNSTQYMQSVVNNWNPDYRSVNLEYRKLISELTLNPQMRSFRGLGRFGGGGFGGGIASDAMMEMDGAPAPASRAMPMMKTASAIDSSGLSSRAAGEKFEQVPGGSSGPEIKLDNVTARKNLQETAFFFPHLVSDKEGVVRIEFEVPEALTKWKFMGLAHDAEQRSGFLTDETVTSKDLMVQPNPPRFLREGDQLEFSVKVSNQSTVAQTGKVRLTFDDLQLGESMDSTLQNDAPEQSFDIPAGQSKSFYWKLKVPDFVGVLSYKAVGATEKLSDGEEGFLPVLSKRILVTESLPLPIRGIGEKNFTFQSLLDSAKSDSIKSQTLTVQMTSNPSWYAVMALPYLMEYPHECNEQVFNRLYANALAGHIVRSDDRIARVFEQWRGTDALDSPLEKNQDLRNVLLEQSPWLLDAKKESQARRNVGVLFDNNRLGSELKRAANLLAERQLSDGSWSWFPGGRENDYITLYITTGYGRLRRLNVDIDVAPAIKSLDRLDWWIDQRYQEIVRRGELDRNNLSSTICLYLYGRSFFLKDKPVDQQYKPAFDYFVAQGRLHWLKLGARQPQGHLAIAMSRLGDRETPGKIMASLTERSKNDEELGMYWLASENGWWWYHAPIETQALMIEAYDEVVGDKAKVEALKVWLIKQKQTQNWKTTKATADAVYALLLRGTSQLASTKLVSVKLDGELIRPATTEAGTGFYEQRLIRDEIKPGMGNVSVTKQDEGVAWGSVHWQYLEDVANIKPYEGTPLTLKKALYRKKNSEKGPVIEPVTGPIHVGDEIVVRVELRTDRDMEYVHLKDYRGSGTEPVNVLSRYKYQDGLAYYESTKDTASHFFIDYLPRGTYVFEYSIRVQHRGSYESGIAELQCMYAPEFNSHSESVTMEVE